MEFSYEDLNIIFDALKASRDKLKLDIRSLEQENPDEVRATHGMYKIGCEIKKVEALMEVFEEKIFDCCF